MLSVQSLILLQVYTPIGRNSTRTARADVESELVLQAQLDDAAAAAAEDFARVRVRQAAVPCIGNRSRRRAQVEMVEGVQKIGANLQAMAFGYRDHLLQPDVPVPGSRPINRIPLGAAPLPVLRRGECPWVEPLNATDYIMRSGLIRVDRSAADRIGSASPPAHYARSYSISDGETGA